MGELYHALCLVSGDCLCQIKGNEKARHRLCQWGPMLEAETVLHLTSSLVGTSGSPRRTHARSSCACCSPQVP